MEFVAAVFCPHPPLLVPEVAAGEPVAVRASALEAMTWLVGQPIEQIMVLGTDKQAAWFEPGSAGGFSGYGVDRRVALPGPRRDGGLLPLSLAVGAWLLEAAGWTGATSAIACDLSGHLPPLHAAAEIPTALLVMGDGSARRSEKAPGWLDERGCEYDAHISSALVSGDPSRLACDLTLGAELLAAGAPSWSAAAHLLAGVRWEARLSYDDAPYGVGYLVATWSRLLPL